MGYVNGVCMVFIVSKKGSLHPSLKDCQVLSCIYWMELLWRHSYRQKHLKHLFSL
jgi:hypothetical protein